MCVSSIPNKMRFCRKDGFWIIESTSGDTSLSAERSTTDHRPSQTSFNETFQQSMKWQSVRNPISQKPGIIIVRKIDVLAPARLSGVTTRATGLDGGRGICGLG